jgi:electron-transferring-flavoprotein dehydrogenase
MSFLAARSGRALVNASASTSRSRVYAVIPAPIARNLGNLGRRSFATEEKYDPLAVERDSDEVDVCIVGGGPAGLSAAIRLKQLEQENGREIRVVVLEKGAEVGKSPYLITRTATNR